MSGYLICFLPLVGLGLVGIFYLVSRNLQIRNRTIRRLSRKEEEKVREIAEERARQRIPRAKPFTGRHSLLPWVLGSMMFVALQYLSGFVFGFEIPWTFSIGFALIFGLLIHQADGMILARRHLKIERQMADSLDLVVSALKAGTGLFGALEMVLRSAKQPLKRQLEEVVFRIRYGEDPRQALQGLETRVPLETFRLFCMAMYTHWEVGGSLAPTLITVGRTIRDRLEISRRIHSHTAQARFSIVTVLFLSWVMVAVAWRNNPRGFADVLTDPTGEYIAAAAVLAQAVGIVWSARLSEMKY